MRASFSKSHCSICNKAISRSGFAMVSHLRKHVREGVLKEATWDGKAVEFKRIDLKQDDHYSQAGAYF